MPQYAWNIPVFGGEYIFNLMYISIIQVRRNNGFVKNLQGYLGYLAVSGQISFNNHVSGFTHRKPAFTDFDSSVCNFSFNFVVINCKTIFSTRWKKQKTSCPFPTNNTISNIHEKDNTSPFIILSLCSDDFSKQGREYCSRSQRRFHQRSDC